MIICVINGTKTYPSMSQGLKIVIENPAMRNKSSYTYDIIFPLDVPANVRFFSHLGVLSVGVKNHKFDDCKLIVDNRVYFSGYGIVTGVNRSEVKMQIVQEVKSSYPEDFKDVYIDKVYYPPVNSRFKQAVFDYGGDTFDGDEHGLIEYTNARPDLENNRFIGEIGKYTFVTTLPGDNTADNVENLVNLVCAIEDMDDLPMYKLAVQPNLIYVLKKVLESKAYSYDLSAIDVEPWKDLYICSSKVSLNIGDALPHWSAEKFFDEIGKLFNVSLSFEGKHAVAVRLWDNQVSQTVKINPEEDFERTYDENGQEYSDTSNLTYALSDTHDPLETVSREAIEKFGIKTYTTFNEMESAVARMSDEEKKTSFFSTKELPELYFWHESTDDDDNDRIEKAGLFRPLFRDLTADNEKTLNIIPVALESDSVPFVGILQNHPSHEHDVRLYLEYAVALAMPYPCVNTIETTSDYVSVQDVVESNENIEQEEEDVPIEVMFVGPLSTEDKNVVALVGTIAWHHTIFETVMPITKGKVNDYIYHVGLKPASLSLNKCNSMTCVGEMQVSQLEIDGSSSFNKNEELTIKFINELVNGSIPSVSNIFLIRNKRYIAKQLELHLTDNGFSKEITGHFYEMGS